MRIAGIILSAALVAAFCGLAFADTIITKDGETIVGKIIEDKDGAVKIRDYDGREIAVKKDSIEKQTNEKSLFDEYDEYVKDKEFKTADEQYKLAVWCRDKKLWVKAVEHYENAAALDPQMAAAKTELDALKSERKKAAAPKKKTYPKKTPGLNERAYVTLDNHMEAYSVYIPPNYSNTKPNEAVILCHGDGMKAAPFLKSIKGACGVTDMLMISLEKCDDSSPWFIPKYIKELEKEFNLDPARTHILAYSGGGFRTFAEVFLDAYLRAKFAAFCFVGCGGGQNPPIDKYTPDSPAICFVADSEKDPNYTRSGPGLLKALKDAGYPDPKFIHTNKGHIFPTDKMKEVFAWFKKQKKKK
jgi:hypothetical protein